MDVINLLNILNSSKENKWYPNHERFLYKRDEKYEYENNNLTFEVNDNGKGFCFDTFYVSESSLNIVSKITLDGFVELPKHGFEDIPKRISVKMYKNYVFVKDGEWNVDSIFVSLNRETFNFLKEHILGDKVFHENTVYELGLKNIPIINLQILEKPNLLTKLFLSSYNLLNVKTQINLFNYYINEEKKGIVEENNNFSDEGNEWLKNMGIYNGIYKPIVKSNGGYKKKGFDVKIKKLSLITSRKDIEKILLKIENGDKLTIRENMIKKYEDEIKNIKTSEVFKKELESKLKILYKTKNSFLENIFVFREAYRLRPDLFKDMEQEIEISNGETVQFSLSIS